MYLKVVVCEGSEMILFALTFIFNLWCICACAQFHTLFSQPWKLKNRIHEVQISSLLFVSASTKVVSQNLKIYL